MVVRQLVLAGHSLARPRLSLPLAASTRQYASSTPGRNGDSRPASVLSAESLASRTPPYQKLLSRLAIVRRILGRPLTVAEKVLYTHLANPEESLLTDTASGKDVRGKATLKLKPDRVAMQDASAQMALLQFMSCGLDRTAVPASIHCDHMIVGAVGAESDLIDGVKANEEVFDFLESAARRYGIDFWPPGAGIIHQTVLENYSAPGLMMLGTDSHTPNAGGLGAIAIGVGGADAVDALVDAPWELRAPKVIGVELTGKLSGWASAKDVILSLAGQLTVRGGTGSVIEYFGSGVQTLSCTGMATICNMGAEVGATTSLFPFSPAHVPYLQATHRGPIAEAAKQAGPEYLAADAGAEYDKIVRIDLSTLEPHINGPFTPDLSTPISRFASVVAEKGWPEKLHAGLIGSCTNSSFEDMSRAEHVVRQAAAAGLAPKSAFFVTPGSEQVRATLEADADQAAGRGALDAFASAGGTVLANACGPCIGQWDRRGDAAVPAGTQNAILTSYNRNFPGRNDGNRATMNFLASPELVTAMCYAGTTTFNPATDSITKPDGSEFRFSPPTGPALPSTGVFAAGRAEFDPVVGQPDSKVAIQIDPESDRLAVLEPFPAFPAETSSELDVRVLVRVQGQCTTDTISAAGPWLKYKGHLPNISQNTLIGAINADSGATNSTASLDGSSSDTIPAVAAAWKADGVDWAVVAEHNYGEGSAREHAALQPRFLGGRMILAKSFARIHETNLKKQGVVPLTFADEADYDRIRGRDRLTTRGLLQVLQAGGQGEIEVLVTPVDGGREPFVVKTRHQLSADQCQFILAGSALNLLAQQAAAKAKAAKAE